MLPERVKSLVMVDLAEPAIGLGNDVAKLPLHITIVPPFVHDRIATSHISRLMGNAAQDIDAFTITAEEEVMPGMNKEDGVFARKVGARSLYVVHNLLMPIVQDFPGTEIDTQFTHDRFTPHSTYIDGQGLQKGDSRFVDTLYLFQKTALTGDDPSWYAAAAYQLGKS